MCKVHDNSNDAVRADDFVHLDDVGMMNGSQNGDFALNFVETCFGVQAFSFDQLALLESWFDDRSHSKSSS